MTIPVIESWVPRELEDVSKMTRRITDVHRFLTNPPAARMVGMKRAKMAKGYSVLPFIPVGQEGAPRTSYETWPGMVPVFKGDWTMGGQDTAWQFVVPVDGRYRITVNGSFNTDADPGDLRHQLAVEIGVNMTTGSGDAIAAASVDTFSPAQVTAYTMSGGHSTVQRLKAGSKVQFAAKCLSSPVFGWANDEISQQYKFGSFAEIRWIGMI
ncbi:hypothetical protein SMD11_1262 [Streptomyces albireticuli]|uniref:Uncharacterized protein n=1 Tax=Streptomyces albireticuli TaxID=1940 RepID=A0A1Z2KXZ2_9ACTN|nr:hypothetical protein [Streptomyces albireticuli]ARZ66923.1 hypothetical protein SMD11_1262 [Streptomyces albireticuli]